MEIHAGKIRRRKLEINMAYVKASTLYKREHKADYGHEKIEILYQDEWLVVINKPSGLLSVPYPGSKSRTALSVLEDISHCRHFLLRQTSSHRLYHGRVCEQ